VDVLFEAYGMLAVTDFDYITMTLEALEKRNSAS